MGTPRTILFAGGGTGGHIFPNLAVLERLREAMGDDVAGHFLVSDRAIDANILDAAGEPYTPLPARPFAKRPAALWRCVRDYRRSVQQVAELIERTGAEAMVGTGGFVTAPALHAAHRLDLPAALVNLDAVPGLASRWGARYASELFTVYPSDELPHAQTVGLPLRRAALATESAEAARAAFGLDPDTPTLLVTAGSQGAASINQTLIALCERPDVRDALAGWQVLHLTGAGQRDDVAAAYAAAGVPAVVLEFCQRMGLAWSAASVALSRAGAGSVAEAWAGRVPTLFLPYPHHRDQHQRLNAEPMVERGGAALWPDAADGARNAAALAAPIAALLTDADRRAAMREALGQGPVDGAEVVAAWVRLTVEGEPAD